MNQATTSRVPTQAPVAPVEQALLLIALGLDPRYEYTNDELHGAWRRRMSQVHPDTGGNALTAAAVNAAYRALTGSHDTYEPIDLRL